jgi:hypothetical protein
LTYRRETRLLALLTLGEGVAAACRAVGISRMTVYRHARSDPSFANRLRAAREHRAAVEDDWHLAAAFLEHEYPERWALPMPGDD